MSSCKSWWKVIKKPYSYGRNKGGIYVWVKTANLITVKFKKWSCRMQMLFVNWWHLVNIPLKTLDNNFGVFICLCNSSLSTKATWSQKVQKFLTVCSAAMPSIVTTFLTVSQCNKCWVFYILCSFPLNNFQITTSLSR